MIRRPLQKVHSETFTGTSSTSSAFTLGQFDIDSLVVKLTCDHLTGTLNATVQTSDDGGTTYYDLGSFSQVVGAITNASAQWMVIPVAGNSSFVNVAPSTGNSSSATATPTAAVTGLPILSNSFRTVYNYVTGSSSATWTIIYYANSQSGVGY